MDMAADANRTQSADPADVEIVTDFPCGAGQDLVRLGGDHYRLTVPADPASIRAAKGYDYYFCAKLTNPSPSLRTVVLDAVRSDHAQRDAGWHPSPVPVFISDDFRRWYVLDEVEVSEDCRRYRCTVPVEGGQSAYVSNSIPCPTERMAAWLDRLQVANRNLAKLTNLGQSARGRDILLLSVTDPSVDESGKDRVLVTSGLHPAEPDWLASTRIIEMLLSQEEWSRRLRREFTVDIVVQSNPDGFDLGTNGCNANGVNLYWDFRPQDIETSPEAVHLWKWIERNPPALYIDYHAYVNQLGKDFRPYIRPYSDYVPSARPIVRAINRRLIDLCSGRCVSGSSTNEPTTLAATITARFHTITYTKFHLHLIHGVKHCRWLGGEVFRAVVDEAWAYRPLRMRVQEACPGQGLAEKWLYWQEQSPLALRIRSRISRAKRFFDHAGGAPGRGEAQSHNGRGLADHWKEALWSHRSGRAPAIEVCNS